LRLTFSRKDQKQVPPSPWHFLRKCLSSPLKGEEYNYEPVFKVLVKRRFLGREGSKGGEKITMNGKTLRTVAAHALFLQFLLIPPAFATVITYKGLTVTASTVDWSTGADTANGAVVEPLTNSWTADGKPYIKCSYNMNNGNYISFDTPTFPSTTSILGQGNQLTFYLKGDGINNNFYIELNDTSGHFYASQPLSTVTSGWELKTLPIGSSVDSSFDWNNVKKIGLTVKPNLGGSGTISIDELTVSTAGGNTTSAQLIADDCEGVAFNNLNGGFGQRGVSTIQRIIAPGPPVPLGGAGSCRAVSVTDTAVNQYSGIYEHLFNEGTPSATLNVTAYNFLTFYVQVTATVTGNLVVELQDSVGANSRVTINFDSVPTGIWLPAYVPLSYFASGVDLANLKTLSFFLPSFATIYFDQITFNFVPNPNQPQILDSLDADATNSAWVPVQSNYATTSLLTVPGQVGSALKLAYNFGVVSNDQYASAQRTFGLNVLAGDSTAFQFDYMGTGNQNNLEFKAIDNQGTIFRLMLNNVTDTDLAWKTLTARYQDMQYFSGNNHVIDWKNITKLSFAISKPSTGSGGTGDFYVSTISYIHSPNFTQPLPADAVINAFSIDNNPFKPQTDSIHSKANFSYTLTQKATVYLKVYDLAGNTVVRVDAGQQAAGSYSLSWDGQDRNGKMVRNGLYLYQFIAEGQTQTQKIKNIIGVAR
jgi:hypothetical protein